MFKEMLFLIKLVKIKEIESFQIIMKKKMKNLIIIIIMMIIIMIMILMILMMVLEVQLQIGNFLLHINDLFHLNFNLKLKFSKDFFSKYIKFDAVILKYIIIN